MPSRYPTGRAAIRRLGVALAVFVSTAGCGSTESSPGGSGQGSEGSSGGASSGGSSSGASGGADPLSMECIVTSLMNPVEFSYTVTHESSDSNVKTKAWSGTTRAEASSGFDLSIFRIEYAYAPPCRGFFEATLRGLPDAGASASFEKYRTQSSPPNQLVFFEAGNCRAPSPINEFGAAWGTDGSSGSLTFTSVTEGTGFVNGMLAQVPVYGEAVEFTLDGVSVVALTTEENRGIPNPATGSFILNGTFRTNCFSVR